MAAFAEAYTRMVAMSEIFSSARDLPLGIAVVGRHVLRLLGTGAANVHEGRKAVGRCRGRGSASFHKPATRSHMENGEAPRLEARSLAHLSGEAHIGVHFVRVVANESETIVGSKRLADPHDPKTGALRRVA
jgi:hypothetical protein